MTAVQLLPAEPNTGIGPGPNGVPDGPPVGYGNLVHSQDDISSIATSLLSEGYGIRATFQENGFSYMARVEPHPPAPERGLNDWHKGVTVYESLEAPKMSAWAWTAIVAIVATAGYIFAATLNQR